MIDLEHLRGLELSPRPWLQRFLVNVISPLDYAVPRTRIELEGIERLPDRPVFLAMNHTDRYGAWPLIYSLVRRGHRHVTTWAKGKYYEKGWMAAFMDATNNIPMPSRGYQITVEFRAILDRTPTEDEYRFLRGLVDGKGDADAPIDPELSPDLRRFVDPGGLAGSYRPFVDGFERRWDRLVDETIRLNRQALGDRNLNILVFPEGTRSPTLLPGRSGLVQMAYHLDATIVPVGCNGSNRLYPGDLPKSMGGRVVYRFGEPMLPDGPELGPFAPKEAFRPLGPAATRAHGEQFDRATGVVMSAIADLLDSEYLPSADDAPEAEAGTRRFI